MKKKLNFIIPLPTNTKVWHPSVVKGFLTNVKYIGDVVGQKYFVIDPMTHRLVKNRGQKPKYYSKNHHEPIIDIDTWNKVQQIYEKRSFKIKDGKQYCPKYSQRYIYSSLIECGICNNTYSRRKTSFTNKDGDTHTYIYWKCSAKIKKDKCETKIAIRETELNDMFIRLFNQLSQNYSIEGIFNKIQKIIGESNDEIKLNQLLKEGDMVNGKIMKLIDLKLSDDIDEDSYKMKQKELNIHLSNIKVQKEEIIKTVDNNKKQQNRLKLIEKEIIKSKGLTEFDEEIFKKIVKRIIVGEIREDGIKDFNIVKFILNIGGNAKCDLSSRKFLSLECDEGFCKTIKM